MALGSAQTLAWGSTYYLPAVLASPMARDLGVASPMVFAAFSLALVVSAPVGPWAGRVIDRRGGRGLLMATNLLFALGLVALAAARGSVSLFAAWALLGLAMGSGLYEAAFATLVTRTPNVRFTTAPMEAFAPNSYDFTMIHLDYHDFYFESEKFNIPRTDPDVVVKTLFAATKPGGIVAVIDHVGPAGDTRAIVDKLHRIDPETVKADFLRGGFVLDGTSNLLRMPSDDLSKNVFDPAIRGKTDRFVFRFKKPR